MLISPPLSFSLLTKHGKDGALRFLVTNYSCLKQHKTLFIFANSYLQYVRSK